MPFKSKAQARLMFKKDPAKATEWLRKYGMPQSLPEHVGKQKKRKHVNPEHPSMLGVMRSGR